MLSTGFQMSLWPGILYELNVGSMHCIRPFDGVPFAAFESQLLIAWGLPPDSCWMICQMRWASASLTLMPCLRSSSIACSIHSCTFCCWLPLFAFDGAVACSGVSFQSIGWFGCGTNGCVFGWASVVNLLA